MTAPDPRVGEIEARLAAATPGPWEERCIDYGDRPSVWKDEEYAFPIGMCVHENCQAEAVYEKQDAEFIAAAPADIAYLLAELRDREGKLARVEGLAVEYDLAEQSLRNRAEGYIDGEYKSRHLDRADEERDRARRIRAAVAAAGGGGDL